MTIAVALRDLEKHLLVSDHFSHQGLRGAPSPTPGCAIRGRDRPPLLYRWEIVQPVDDLHSSVIIQEEHIGCANDQARFVL